MISKLRKINLNHFQSIKQTDVYFLQLAFSCFFILNFFFQASTIDLKM